MYIYMYKYTYIHMYVAARGLCTRVTVVAFPDLTDAITMFSDVITVYWYIFKYIYIYII